MLLSLFFFNDTATTEIYTLSLHDALPIWDVRRVGARHRRQRAGRATGARGPGPARGQHLRRAAPRHARPRVGVLRLQRRRDRKSTRLNSSHANISYAVFCLKKKKNKTDLI